MKPSEKKPSANIGVLLLMHTPLAEAFLEVLTHVMGARPAHCGALSAQPDDDTETLFEKVKAQVAALDQGVGVLIVIDICGATPYQIAQRVVQNAVEGQRVALVCGANVPMLVRALTYREENLETVVQKALSGGQQGVVYVKDNREESGDCNVAL
jgi:PTS system ascorbate-specific IIA component